MNRKEDLLVERSKLLDKKFAGTATRYDLARLAEVRWAIEAIEDSEAAVRALAEATRD